jgi:single-stranded DNA-binding protein
MDLDFNGVVKTSYSRTTPQGACICEFMVSFPTTVKVDKETGETRRDTIKCFIFGEWGEKYLDYKGPVRVVGDLRINRYLKDGVWMCSPEVAVKNIYKLKDRNEG